MIVWCGVLYNSSELHRAMPSLCLVAKGPDAMHGRLRRRCAALRCATSFRHGGFEDETEAGRPSL